MPKLNERLSNWDALHSCFCGYWSWTPGRNVYDHIGADRARSYANAGACKVCGYDLTRSPLDNLKALTANDWVGVVKGSCLYTEAGFAIPEGATCEFVNCNLDNVTLPRGVTVTGGSHRLVKRQNDGGDWVCDWATAQPVAPTDIKTRLREGINVDPAKLPAKRLTDEQIKAAEQKRLDALELAQTEAKATELRAKMAVVEGVR